jgi:uncharacterized protein
MGDGGSGAIVARKRSSLHTGHSRDSLTGAPNSANRRGLRLTGWSAESPVRRHRSFANPPQSSLVEGGWPTSREEKKMVIRATAGVFLVTLVFGRPALAPAAPPPRTVTVTARGQASVVPDFVEIRLGVSTQAPQLADAKRDNDKKTAAVLAVTRKHAVPKDDLQLNVQITPMYDERGSAEIPKLRGYRIYRHIEIRLRDFSKVEPLLSDALSAGVNVVDGLEYQSTKHRENQAEARRLAVEVAKEKATHLAQLTGLKLGKAIQISEELDSGGGFDYAPAAKKGAAGPPAREKEDGPGSRYHVVLRQKPQGNSDAKGGKAGKDETEIPLAPGKLFVRVTVNITFELRD